MQETLTVTRLGITGRLKRTLQCTNTIENLFSRVRRTQHNIERRGCLGGVDGSGLLGSGVGEFAAERGGESCEFVFAVDAAEVALGVEDAGGGAALAHIAAVPRTATNFHTERDNPRDRRRRGSAQLRFAVRPPLIRTPWINGMCSADKAIPQARRLTGIWTTAV
jgi:hypothetical protein